MFKIKNLTILMLLLSLGCATKHNNIEKIYSSWESSGSPCIDALTINMNASGCEEVTISESQEPLGRVIYCVKASQATPWTLQGFLVLQEGYNMSEIPGDLYPFCFDKSASIMVFELD